MERSEFHVGNSNSFAQTSKLEKKTYENYMDAVEKIKLFVRFACVKQPIKSLIKLYPGYPV